MPRSQPVELLVDRPDRRPSAAFLAALAAGMAFAAALLGVSQFPPPPAAREAPFSARFVSVAAFPSEITLAAKSRSARILVTGVQTNGLERDVSKVAIFSSDRPDIVVVEPGGFIRGVGAGVATIRARVAGRAVTARVSAPPGPEDTRLSFVNDILPVLSKAGCNAGSCHAKPEGQNGFKLSVFAYDPKSDYAKIVKDDRGRRVFPAFPEESLLLRKPTMAVEHQGGQRFERGSPEYLSILAWLKQGMPYNQPDDPSLLGIKVYPGERRYERGVSQQLMVLADYSDGSRRDVTRLADFSSNDKEMAKVDDAGVVTVGPVGGEGVVIARFMGLVDISRVTVPSGQSLPDSLYSSPPVNNEIDKLVYARLQKLGVEPSAGCSDAEFLRRASLDTTGSLPGVDEARRFLAEVADSRPGATTGGSTLSADARRQAAREALIDRLLNSPAYANYWAVKWGDLIRPNPYRVGVKPVYLLDEWLRESFRENKPYDQFVRELVTAEGSTHRYGPVALFRDKREPGDASSFVSQVFLGVRMDCARCHHHPNEKWSQTDYYQLAAYFAQLKRRGQGISPPISGLAEQIWFAPGGEVRHPVTGELMTPKPPDGAPPEIPPGEDPRAALADWMSRPDNPFFARAIVNRVWANFMGRGIVDPVDDFRASNPPTNEPLLDWLARDFVSRRFDLKHLMRTIMRSRVYQLSSLPNERNMGDTKNFSRWYRRRLGAEALLDAVGDVTGVPENLDGLPPAARAVETWNNILGSEFLDAFGRPNPSAEAPCERDTKPSVVQALHLMNSNRLQDKISSERGRARKLAESKLEPREIVAELYLAAYSRPPSDDEAAVALKAFSAKGATRQTAAEDVLWALLNSAEFVFNH